MTETAASTVRHPHGGVDWELPLDLLEIQRRFDAANADCARLAEGEDRDAFHAACQLRLELVLDLHRHPWLIEQTANGRRHQADTALKHLARAAGA